MKRILAVLLAVLMLTCSVSLAESASPEPIYLTAFATAGPYTKGDFNDLSMWRVMEELTNVYISFDAAPSGQSAEKLGLLFASNNLPDIIFKTGLGSSDIANYAAEGQIVPIDEYLEECCPNFTALCESMPSIVNAITQADGHIYGFPYIVTCSSSNIVGKPFYNAKYLESIGAAEPDTLDDLVELLRQFKDSDWNGNGVADEIPLTSQDLATLMSAFYGCFGIGTRGNGSKTWDIDLESGELRYVPTSENYKQLLQFMNSVYTEGLLDQEIFTNDTATFQAKGEQNILFFAPATNSTYFTSYMDDFKGLTAPLTGPTGVKFWAGKNLAISACNTFITSKCEHIKEALSYFDYFFSDDGLTLFFMGIEGETFEYDENHVPHYTEYVTANPDGMGMEEALGTYVCWSGGGNPSVADDIHFGDNLINATTMEAARNVSAYGPDVIWGNFTYTTEESEYLADLQLDIDTYVSDMTAAFISGSESFDKWDSYVSRINSMGLDDYREIVQAAMERYNAVNA